MGFVECRIFVTDIDLTEIAANSQVAFINLVTAVAVAFKLDVDPDLKAVIQRGGALEMDFRIRLHIETGKILGAVPVVLDVRIAKPLFSIAPDTDFEFFRRIRGNGRNDESRRYKRCGLEQGPLGLHKVFHPLSPCTRQAVPAQVLI